MSNFCPGYFLANLAALLDTRDTEIKSTMYAAWNNLILKDADAELEAILYEARQNWDPKKMQIPRWKFIEGMHWLIANDLMPNGTGKAVLKKIA